MATLVQAIGRVRTAEIPTETARPPALPSPVAVIANPAGADDRQPSLPARPDVPFAPMPPLDWNYDEPPPRRDRQAGDDALTVEAELSMLGLFRLETRPVGGGFAVVVRHALDLEESGLEALAETVVAEAERYGVGARIRFVHDPALRPSHAAG